MTMHDLSLLLDEVTGGRPCEIMQVPSQRGIIHLTIPAGSRRDVEQMLYHNAPAGIHFEIQERS